MLMEVEGHRWDLQGGGEAGGGGGRRTRGHCWLPGSRGLQAGFSGRPGHGQDMGKDGLVRKNTKEAANEACLGRGERSIGVWAGKTRGLGLWSPCPYISVLWVVTVSGRELAIDLGPG